MHPSAYLIGKDFFRLYWRNSFKTIVDVGSYDLNGSLRQFKPESATYIGVDLESGPGVDVVRSMDRPMPIADASVDVVVCSSVLEHDGFFWETFVDIARVLRPGGLIYINVPSNGWFHLHPDDNWRFYPDAGVALARWASRNGVSVTLVESFVAEQVNDVWNDFVAVFARDDAPMPPTEFLHERFPSFNVRKLGEAGRLRVRHKSQDMVEGERLGAEIAALRKRLADLEAQVALPAQAPQADAIEDSIR